MSGVALNNVIAASITSRLLDDVAHQGLWAIALGVVATVIVLPGAVSAASAAPSLSDYQVTVAARYCADYTDVTANQARIFRVRSFDGIQRR